MTDDDTGTATDTTTVTVNNVAPTVNTPVVSPSPSNEGQSVVASATFSDPGTLDTHTCTVDYGDGAGPQAGTVSGTTCTGPSHTYVDDNPTGTASDPYTVTIVVIDDDTGNGSNSVVHTVNNVAPVINSITTNGPVPQGQQVTITVDAADVGINDILTPQLRLRQQRQLRDTRSWQPGYLHARSCCGNIDDRRASSRR